MADRTGPLHGLVVFDLTRVLAGPTCVQMLADFGADVIKIEKPGSGDDTRGFAPPYVPGTQESAYFVGVNRNKRSVTLDISKPEGQALALRLVEQSDILVENFKVGALAKYGLGYEQLHARFPGLVYCSITGFGQTGPYAPRPGYDSLVQAMGGVMSLTGEPEGEPMKVGVPVADVFAGLYGCIGNPGRAAPPRAETGQGQQVDIGMLDTHMAWLANQGASFMATWQDPVRLGNSHPSIVPYGVYPTEDGFVVITVANDPTFNRFCEAFDLAWMPKDPSLRHQFGPGDEPRGRGGGDHAGVEAASDRLVGRAAGGAEDRLRARSTRSPRPSPTRRCRRAAWWWRWRTRPRPTG